MNTHVFIVDSNTLKYHLEYLFAGTGAKDYIVDFNNGTETMHKHNREQILVGMIADACRVRKGDFIIFYLQQNFTNKIWEGKFYGIFKAKDDWSFLDNNDKNQYLHKQLGKSLTFRTLIEPYKVYPEGVTEWEALDEIKHIQSPHQMLWSLIYRKLKGNRGNTMITIYESERLCQLIRNKNNRNELNYANKLLSFDSASQTIITGNKSLNKYDGRTEEINILPRLISKYGEDKAFEQHLQAYIVKNIVKRLNKSLDKIIVNDTEIEWLGNEVSYGVGMQRIDIMLSVVHNEQRILIPIELKAVEASENNTVQIQRYIDWIEQYYIPNRQSDIQPVLISRKIEDKQGKDYQEIIKSFNTFNTTNRSRCSPLRFVEFNIKNNDLIFEEVKY